MRILMLAQFYPPDIGGEERHARNLAMGLVARGHDVEVVTTHLPGTRRGLSLEDGVVVQRVAASAQRIPGLHSTPARPHALPVPDPEVTRFVARRLRDGDFDVVHAHNWIVNSAVGPAERAGVPLVLTLHDYSHVCAVKRFMRFGSVCEGPGPWRCARCAADHYGTLAGPSVAAANAVMAARRNRGVARFVAVSASVANRNGLRRAGVAHEIVPNFVPASMLVDVPQAVPDGPLLFVGDLTEDKGIRVLLDAYRSLHEAPQLLAVGRDAGLVLDVPPGVEILPPKPHEAVIELMRSSQAVIVPSLVPDSCPTVVLEAMALGKPVIAAASGGIVDMVQDGESGLLVPPGDAPALAGAIAAVHGDEARLQAMAKRAVEAVVPFLDASVIDRIEQLYREVLASD